MMTTTNHIINKYTAILRFRQINPSSFLLNSVKFLLIYVLTFLPCLIFASNPVYAQTAPPETSLPIIPDGTTNTQMDRAANGVPIVNIAAPNTSGMSINHFQTFNVNQEGAIINNSIGNQNDVFQTQLGGLIMNNPNLRNSGAANVIVNAVTSNQISYINGPQEIAGDRKTDYVFVNPNSTVFNGASFINVSRFTAVVGSVNGGINPNLNNLTFSLGSSDSINQLIANGTLPKIVIMGAGIDLSNVSSTDLVANAMNIVAPIYGGNNTVNIRTGDKEFNYATKEVTSYDNTATPPPDAVAIDASNFAKIQAGRIFIVGNKKGFAIRWTADMLAMREGINIDNQGNITFGNLGSEIGDIDVKSREGSVNTTGTIQTKGVSNDITLTAKTEVNNTGSVIGSRNININANQFNNSKVVSGAGNVIVNSNVINNSPASVNAPIPTILALQDINLNTNNLNNSSGKIGADGALKIKKLSLTNPSSNLLFTASIGGAEINNLGGLLLAALSIDFDLGNSSDFTITGTVNTTGHIDIAANNITNQGSVSATDYIKVNATGSFNNGYDPANNVNSATLNPNVKLASGTYLDVTATNLLNNYGTLSSTTNLILTSTNFNINNYQNAKIIGGTGTTTLNALLGSINQNSSNSLVANGDMVLNAINLNNNSGGIDVKNNLTTNITNDLNNNSTYIYSGVTMTLNVANNLINNQATIYSEGNFIARKDATNAKINKLENISGEITSYNGTVNIGTSEFINRRSTLKTQTVTVGSRYCGFEDNGCYWYYPTYYTVGNEPIVGKSLISSKGLMTINTNNFTNNSSDIITGGNLVLNVSGNFKNIAQEYKQGTYIDILNDNGWQNPSDGTTIIKPYTVLIKAAGSITGSAASNINNNTIRQYDSTPNDIIQKSANLNNPETIINNGTINTDFVNYLNGTNNQGLFTKNPNPNSPLFETRSQFIDQSQFFGSNYFYTKIGLNLTDVQTQFEQQNKRLVGDQFFQSKIIEEQLKTISKNSFLLSQSETNVNNEIKSLYDNAADEYTRLGLNLNQPLTQSQINNLQKDIIWFGTEIIDNQAYVVPKIYLSKNTRDNLKNNDSLAKTTTISAGGDINLTSTTGNIINSGSIVGNNITLTAAGDIANKNFSDITAIGNLSLSSTAGSITNLSKLKANGDLSLTAATDVNNNSTVNTKYLGSDIISTLTETASVSAGNLIINAGNNFNNEAAEIKVSKNDLGGGITSTGNAGVTVGNDINITTLELRNRTETSWGSRKKGGTNITDTTTNLSSNLNISGDLSLTTTATGAGYAAETADAAAKTAADQTRYDNELAAYNTALANYQAKQAELAANPWLNKRITLTPPTPPSPPIVYAASSDINITGSNISTTSNGSNITINANGSVNIASAVDSSSKTETYHKKGTMVEKSSIDINSSTTNVSSNITSLGNLSIISGSDTNIIASNLSGTGSGSITSGGNTNIFNGVDTTFSYSNSTTTRTGLLRQMPGYSQVISAVSTIMSVDLSTINGLTGGNLENIQKAGGIDYNKSIISNSSNTETLVASNLNFGNNLTINSNTDLTVKASNLKTTAGDITLAAGGDVNILSAAATNTSNNSYKDKSDRAKERGSTNITEISNISSTIISGSDLNITSGNNTILQSSRLSSGDSLNVNTGNSLLLLTASDASIKDHESKGGTAFAFSNGNSGFVATKAVNNEITSNTNSANLNSNLNLNATNSIVAQYRAGTMEDVLSSANNNNPQLAYLKTLNDLSNTDPSKITFNPVADTMKNWDQTTRGLTQAGTAVVAIAAVAITVVTLGSGATIGAAMLTAAAASAAATASVSATNASMNTDSSLLGSTTTITKTTVKDTTSKESVQNMAIAAATAGATYGVTSYLNTGSFTGTGSVANNSTIYVNPNLSNATVLTTNTANSSSLLANLGSATVKVGTATISNIAATSAIKGQSIGEVIAEQGGTDQVILNTALQIAAQVGAQQIGNAAHGSLTKNPDGTFTYNTPTINQGQQIALHAALGCGVGVGMSGGISGCAAGAAAGVIGELTGEAALKVGLNNNQAVALAGVAGGLSSIVTGSLTGDSDHKMAQNIYSGQMLGSNAAQNNSAQAKIMDDEVDKMWLKGEISDSEYQQYQQGRLNEDKLAGKILLGAMTLGAGSAIGGSMAVGEGLLAAKGTSALISGTFGSIGAVTTSYMGGERNTGNLLLSGGVGFGAGVIADSFAPKGILGIATTTGVGGAAESAITTYFNNPNASLTEITNSGFRGGVTAFTSGLVAAPILIYGGSSLPVQIVAGQTALGTGLSTSALMQTFFPSNPAKTNQLISPTINQSSESLLIK